jgi:predicted TPR repeat methyltransferase
VLEIGNPEEAIRGFDAALTMDPRHVFSWTSRGNAFMRMKRYAEALSNYETALAIEPGFRAAQDNRKIALYGLGRLDRCPPEQLSGLFDEYASNYDESMLQQLGYRGHIVLRELAGRLIRDGNAIRIADLGCGTGLVGAAFADLARGGRLDGIDVSAAMIGKSRERAVYTQLIQGDIEDVLSTDGVSYDLIVSADTIIYFGALNRLFALVRQRLVPAGLFLLALEAKSGEAWEQTPANRFRHSESYVRSVCAETGFSVLVLENFHIRREHNQPVEGFAIALRAD